MTMVTMKSLDFLLGCKRGVSQLPSSVLEEVLQAGAVSHSALQKYEIWLQGLSLPPSFQSGRSDCLEI